MPIRFDHAATADDVAALMQRSGCTQLVVEGLPNAEYHRCPALSRSGVTQLLRSPLHFHATRQHDPRIPARTPSPEMEYGSLVHAMALQPLVARQEYHRGPQCDSRAAKAWKTALAGIPVGQQLVMREDYRRALRQTRVLRRNTHLAQHLARPQSWPEVSCFWRDHVTGMWLMCRPDSMAVVGLPGDEGIEILDLKTCKDASPEGFASSCANFRYDLQAAMYSAGVEVATGVRVVSFLIIASESSWPHATEAYQLEPDWVDAAADDARLGINNYAACASANVWPGYSDGSVQLLRAPRWRARQIEREAMAA